MSDDVDVRMGAYSRAQHAMVELKSATLELLMAAGSDGLKNSQIGRLLGIYRGHVGHQGHISRTILEMLQDDGVAEQEGKGGPWRLLQQTAPEPNEDPD